MKRIKIALTALLFLPTLMNASVVVGSYIGNGSGTNAISGLGITPVLILIKGAGGQDAWIATSTMSSGYAMRLTGLTGVAAGMISSIDADGFTLDKTLGISNESGVVYYYSAWSASDVTTGSFTPNDCSTAWSSGTWYSSGAVISSGITNYQAISGHTAGASDEPGVGASWATKWTSLGSCSNFNENISVGFEPGMVWLFGGTSTWYEGTYPQMSFNGAQPTYAHRFNNGARVTIATHKILNNFSPVGFQTTTSSLAGTHSGPSVGVQYHYAAFDKTVSSYAGANSAAQSVSLTVDPAFVIIKNVGGASDNSWWKTSEMPVTSSYKFTGSASTISIDGFSSSPNEFSVGTNGEVNGVDDYEFIAFGGPAVLPVELISFDAEKALGGVNVTWTTASEIDNDYFEVYTSVDGIHWKAIGTVNGAGNTTEVNDYNLYDFDIDRFDKKYYKLAQFDFDGKMVFSETRVVNFSEINEKFSAFDDGENVNISFNSNSEEEVVVSIFDVNAKVIVKKTFSNQDGNSSVIKLHPVDIASGIYFVILQNAKDTYTVKLPLSKR
jgi:hypothetical protein